MLAESGLTWKLLRPRKLLTRMVVLMVGFTLLQTLVIGSFFLNQVSLILEDQIGKRALQVSQSVSLIPEIRDALEKEDPDARIQAIAEPIRKATGATFIVVGDKEGKRYAHPVPERLGQHMVGGDNRDALEFGKSYVSKSVGTLGPSIRGKVPIFNEQQDIIGVVSVGYLLENVNFIITAHQQDLFLYIGLFILFGIICAFLMAKGIKKDILGLEPDEIARLFEEKNAILESIREGVIAINAKGQITMINQAAFKNIGLDPASYVLGQHIKEVIPDTGMLDVLKSGQNQLNQELMTSTNEVIVNRVPIFQANKVSGVVASFQKKTDLDYLAQKLSQVEEYSELLRIQTHEYANKLNTISGLIHIGAYDKAIDLICKETSGYQELINFLVSTVQDPVIAGMILGKYNQAQEYKINFQIDRESSMKDVPEHINREKILTILGNLLDNAFDSVMESSHPQTMVQLSMTDIGNNLVFEVEDSGKGVDTDLKNDIFKKGVTTKKGQGRGIGLYLVKKALEYLRGDLTISQTSENHTVFTVYIPKERL